MDIDQTLIDLPLEILRIIHHNPGITKNDIFKNATLAMDEKSCTDVIDKLINLKLIEFKKGYKITNSGIHTLIPIKTSNFPQNNANTHLSAIKKEKTTVKVTLKENITVIEKDGVSISLNQNEMSQLYSKLKRDHFHIVN